MPTVRIAPKLRVLNNEAPPSAVPEKALEPSKKKRAGKKSTRRFDDHTPLEYPELNRSELIVLANAATLPGVSAVATREMLIEALEGLLPIRVPNPMIATKTRLLKWFTRHKDKLQMQVPEDIKERLDSSDYQVAFYYLKNKDQMT